MMALTRVSARRDITLPMQCSIRTSLTMFRPCAELPDLNLSPEERRLFAQVFAACDTNDLGVVTGDVALKFFPGKTKLPSKILGEVSREMDIYFIFPKAKGRH
jgi:hypothetical protein